MNFRTINIIAVLLVIAAAMSVYRIKYQATWQAVEVERLERAIAREKTAINVLETEWAHLRRPDRIQKLAENHLDLKLATPDQRIALADLPMRPVQIDAIAETIASLGMDNSILERAAPVADDPIGRTIEAMGLAVPSADPFAPGVAP